MPLEQGQQILLGQAEFLGQQIAGAGVDRHAFGPCFPQTEAVGAGHIRGKIVAVVLDDAHLQPLPAQSRQQFFQQGGLAAVVYAADGQHRRALELQFFCQSLFGFNIQSKAPPLLRPEPPGRCLRAALPDNYSRSWQRDCRTNALRRCPRRGWSRCRLPLSPAGSGRPCWIWKSRWSGCRWYGEECSLPPGALPPAAGPGWRTVPGLSLIHI